LDRINANKPAKLLDFKSLTLGVRSKQIWPVFYVFRPVEAKRTYQDPFQRTRDALLGALQDCEVELNQGAIVTLDWADRPRARVLPLR
jgi:hypothetical protein